MADEQDTIAPLPELDTTPAIAAEQETEKPETILDPGEEADIEAEEAAAEPPVELVTIERNGKTFQIPKELEGELLMQSDYTKKTQSVAERQRELDARATEIEQQARASDEELSARANLQILDARLAEYAKLTPQDWQYHEQNDPLAAQSAWREYQMLQQQRNGVAETLQSKQTERTQKAQQDLAKRIEDTLRFASKEIPNFKPELTKTLVEYAQAQGIDEDTIKRNWSPTFYKLLHRAHLGEQLLQKQSAPKPTAPPVAPLQTVAGKSTPGASRSLTDLARSDDIEAYVAARKAGRVR